MKVSQALEKLRQANPDAELIVSSDEEGNEYRRAVIDPSAFFIDYGGYIEICHSDDVAAGLYEDETLFEGVILW